MLQINQIARATVLALLAFVLVFAPVTQSIAMPAGHMNAKVLAVAEDDGGHQHGSQTSSKSTSSCDDAADPSKSDQNCCDVGCLTVANINGSSDVFIARVAIIQHVRTEQQLHARVLNGLKRPPRF